MIERVLPAAIASYDIFGRIDKPEVWPAEWSLVEQACDKRVQQFSHGRHSLRQAMRILGAADIAVPKGLRGEPVFPSGLVGSVTHCDGYCAAAVAFDRSFCGIGIDAEPDQPLKEGILEYVSVASERERLRQLPRPGNWDRLLFSAKESVYKAWYPLTGSSLGFHDVTLDFDLSDSAFRIEFLRPIDPQLSPLARGMTGRYIVREGLILTSTIIEPMSQRTMQVHLEAFPTPGSFPGSGHRR